MSRFMTVYRYVCRKCASQYLHVPLGKGGRSECPSCGGDSILDVDELANELARHAAGVRDSRRADRLRDLAEHLEAADDIVSQLRRVLFL